MPTRAEWFQHGILGPNHGPWHVRFESLLVLSPYLFLVPVTFVTSLVLSVFQRRLFLWANGLVICFMFVLMASVQMEYLGWVID